MKNAELIKNARTIADSIHVHSSFQDWEAAEKDTLEKCADALEAAMKEIDRKNEEIQRLRSEIADIKDEIRATAVAIYEYEGSYADCILDIIGEGDRDIDEVNAELEARMAKGEHDEH